MSKQVDNQAGNRRLAAPAPSSPPGCDSPGHRGGGGKVEGSWAAQALRLVCSPVLATPGEFTQLSAVTSAGLDQKERQRQPSPLAREPLLGRGFGRSCGHGRWVTSACLAHADALSAGDARLLVCFSQALAARSRELICTALVRFCFAGWTRMNGAASCMEAMCTEQNGVGRCEQLDPDHSGRDTALGRVLDTPGALTGSRALGSVNSRI